MVRGCPKQNVYHMSEKLKVINTTLFLFYAIIAVRESSSGEKEINV